MNRRIKELDFLKCILILLMILFHLVYIGDLYPYLKAVVYTFHMPGFLIISGFLLNTDKSLRAFTHMIWWIFVPYIVMESAYVAMASLLPIREHIDHLTISVLLEKILLEPIGPYWYLHTMMLCSVVWYLTTKMIGCHDLIRLSFYAIGLYLLSRGGLIAWESGLYFLIGVAIRCTGIPFTKVFAPHLLSLIPLVGLCLFGTNLDRGTLPGIAIVYFSISFLLALYPYVTPRLDKVTAFIGRNTLPLLLFSPIFTLLAKGLVPLFVFDPTGILFAVGSVAIAVTGCFFIVWMMDRIGFSRWFFGKVPALQSY